MFGAILAGAKMLGSTLARAGIIRGTLGKVLGGVAQTGAGIGIGMSIPQGLPTFPTTPINQAGVGMIVRPGVGLVAAGAGALAGRAVTGAATSVTRKYGAKIMALLASGLLFEAGGKLYNAVTGQEHKVSRRMNYSNPRALRKSIRRVEGASKQYAKLLRATVGGVKKCGYTVKPRKGGKRCG